MKNKAKHLYHLSLSVLNGIAGNHIHSHFNSLSIKMNFYYKNEVLPLEEAKLKQYILEQNNNSKKISPKICILIHGLTHNEHAWNFADKPEQNYATLLQNDLQFVPFYLRYNTGLHISDNAKKLNDLIENLVKSYPVKIEEIVVIAHSMGGLVLRSACYYAEEKNTKWLSKVKKIFFLGSPHLGAPLEKLGNITSNILEVIPNPFTKMSAKLVNLRSSGIKDLRFGYLHHNDWKNKQDQDDLLTNNKKNIPLAKNIEHYLITGTLTKNPNHPFSKLLGDALVRKSSATGKANKVNNVDFSSANHKEFPGHGHLKLLKSHDIYEQIKIWCEK